MNRTLIDDCFVTDRDRILHADAIALLKSRLAPIVATERVALDDAFGRIAAESVVAPAPVPAHTNAAVDGYAFRHADAGRAAAHGLTVTGRAAAGHPFTTTLPPSAAIRIFTGAVLPAAADTVAMQEDCERVDRDGAHFVRIPAGLKAGANVRKAGEDVATGATVVETGATLRPQDLAALASVGVADIAVFRPLRVAILSSGDEIVAPGRPLAAGQVYDANAPMLRALISAAGGEPTNLGIAPDSAAVVEAAVADAARRFDVLITTGGASQGEEDHLTRALGRLGTRHLWQLAIKPGRPMAFGQIDAAVVASLPGNPVAVFVCFLMYVHPMLRRLAGAPWPEPHRWPLPAAFAVPKRKIGRREFWRGTLRARDGILTVEKFERDGSGLISGLRAADGLIEVAEGVASISPGDPVSFIPFNAFGISER